MLDTDYPVIEITERSIPPRHFARFKCRACSQPLSQEKPEKSAPRVSVNVNPPQTKPEIFQPRKFRNSRLEESGLDHLDDAIPNSGKKPEIDRLDIPERINIKTRTFEPNIETLLTQPKEEKPLLESQWGEQTTEFKKIPWKWYAGSGAMVCLVLIIAGLWSKYGYQAMQKSRILR
ncbi:MAG: hypothetical protein HC845_09860 [Akkermansiaceae bacterium]|nr:hypothetical protein [Akkermansiaceae bacterium]